MTKLENGNTEEKYDIAKQVDKRDSKYRITIDYLSVEKVKEIHKLLEDHFKNHDWRDRIIPSHITVEKHSGTDLTKCGRDGCTNLILSFDSFCSEYCLKNYVSYDEDEMK